MLSYEEIQAKGIKKGDVVRFTNSRNPLATVFEGEVIKKQTKTVSGGKFFNGRYWQDNKPRKIVYLIVEVGGSIGTIGEDTFYTLEKVVPEAKKTNDLKVFEEEGGQLSLFSPKYEIECVVEYDIFDFMEGNAK